MTVTASPVPLIGIGAFASGVALVVLVGFLRRHRGQPGASWFMLSLSMHALWCLAYAVGLFVFDRELRLAFEVLSWIGFSWIGVFFLAFALEYTGRTHLVRQRSFALLGVIPAITTGLLVTVPYHDLLWSGFEVVPTLGVAAADYMLQSWAYVLIGAGMIYAGLAVVLLLDTVVNYGPMYRREAVAVALSSVPVTGGLLIWVFGLGPIPLVNWGVVLSLPHALFDAYAFVGSGMFQTNPATRRAAERNAIDDLPNPVFILDPDQRVVDLNTKAEAVFETASGDVTGSSLESVSGVELDRSTNRADQTVTRQLDDRVREFRVTKAPLTGATDEVVGYTVVFQDVTAERETQQRLAVLNRVLRHNLRNKMTAMMGYAEEIEHRADDEQLSAFATEIVENGEALTAIGEKIRAFDQVRDQDRTFERVDIGALIAELTSEFEQRYPAGTIERPDPASPTVYTNRAMLRLALDNVLENAFEHGGPDARVEISVTDGTTGDSPVEITVRDDGPGIPAAELRPILSGEEADLTHGSSIGLWIVRWCLDAIDATVEYESTETGTAVHISLPTDPALTRPPEPSDG